MFGPRLCIVGAVYCFVPEPQTLQDATYPKPFTLPFLASFFVPVRSYDIFTLQYFLDFRLGAFEIWFVSWVLSFFVRACFWTSGLALFHRGSRSSMYLRLAHLGGLGCEGFHQVSLGRNPCPQFLEFVRMPFRAIRAVQVGEELVPRYRHLCH